jgi:hypothetical protein
LPFKIVERPPIYVARRVGVASPSDMAHMLDRAHASLVAASALHRCALVYDAGNDPAGRPDARARQLSAAWIAQHERLLIERCAGWDFAFPNPLSRGVLTAILWLKAPPFETRIHGSCAEALASAARRVHGPVDVPSLLEALDAAPLSA